MTQKERNMEDMTQEEKAQAYNEAINTTRNLVKAGLIYEDVAIQIFPKLAKSEDERIRQFLIHEIEETSDEIMSYRNMNKKDVLAWLKKQGEHANFRNKIQVGDKVTRNKDGILVNLSQLNRVAKKDNKQSVRGNEEETPTWSEEDSVRLQRIIDFLWYNRKGDTDTIYQQEQDIKWLKSLKEKMQPQQEWSEEDESMHTRCIGILGKCYMGELPTKVEEELNWLKSLRYRVRYLENN